MRYYERMFDVAPTVLDALAFPDEVAAGLAQWAPQALLVDVLGELAPAALSVDGQIDALVAVQRHMGLLQAQEVELLAALDAGDSSRDGFTRDSVAAALRVPPASMNSRMSSAPGTWPNVSPTPWPCCGPGRSPSATPWTWPTPSAPSPPESAAVVEAAVLPRAPELTQAQFRAAVRRAVLRVTSPAEEDAAHQHAVGERRVVLIPADYGMAWVNCYLSADCAADRPGRGRRHRLRNHPRSWR